MPMSRAEALKAIEHVRKMLEGPPLDPMGQRQCLATLDFAKEQVEAIQEVKKRRKVATA